MVKPTDKPNSGAGIASADTPRPVELTLDRSRSRLRLRFNDGEDFELSSEYLRVHSPSAEVRGHGRGGGVLPLDKSGVLITAIEPIGNYAVRLVFDDGHNSGLYTWAWLYRLGRERETLWAEYLRQAGIRSRQA
jgi:DUF971 family protein